MRNIFKEIFIPSGEKKPVTAYESWVVRWKSIENDDFYHIRTVQTQAEVFTSKEDAHKFATSLREARSLLKDSGFNISITANQ